MKIKIGLLLFLLLIAIFAVTAQAQDDEPLDQPAIDAAVSTLLAETQTAGEQQATQMVATQTIQAALDAALTATAQFAPTATPLPFNAADVEVASTEEIALRAGPGNTSAYLATDGERFVYAGDEMLCLYEGSVEQRCADTSQVRALDLESVRWSPDSRYIVFAENFFRLFVDSDIWLWDTESKALTNLTDDGDFRFELDSDNWTGIDMLPRWLPDGRIIFLRYSEVDGERVPPDIYTIAPDGSGLEQIGTVEADDAFAIYVMDATADQLAYVYYLPGGSESNGVWVSALDGSDAQRLTTVGEDEIPPISLDLSPDGRYALGNTYTGQYNVNADPEASFHKLIDLQSGEMRLIDSEHFVVGAGWSPDGSVLAYVVRHPLHPEDDGLYIRRMDETTGRRILEGTFNVATSLQRQTLEWGTNNTILLSRSPQEGIVLVHLE